MINRLVIIGVGLIGSSLALSLKQSSYVKTVIGCGRSEDNLKKGIELGVLDEYSLSIAEAIKGADVVIVAVPLGAMKTVFKQMQLTLEPSTVVSDVGSAKGSVIFDAREILGNNIGQFVAGHPIAGSENSGVEAGFSSLFKDRKVILTPEPDTASRSVQIIENMWQKTGAKIEIMTQKHHDRVLAATSHLPHLLAFSLVSHLSKMSDHDDIFNYVAGGFRDFTRIASSDPVMWRDICLANGDALLELIDGFKSELDNISNAIEHQNSETLFELFRDSKHTRDQLRDL